LLARLYIRRLRIMGATDGGTRLLTPDEGATVLGLKNKRAVHGAVARGVIPAAAVVWVGKQLRLNAAELETYIMNGGRRLRGGKRETTPPATA
jgi:hypothetical protein